MTTAVVLCFVSVFAVAINVTNGSAKGTSSMFRVVGGDPGQITQYPYQAQLQRGSLKYRCGGSIISEEYILTAAHCVYIYPPELIKVRVGSTFVWEGGQLYNVSEKFVHPKYNTSIYDYDVAVLKVSNKMIINNNTTKIVKLADAGSLPTPGDYLKVSGWGKTKEGGKDPEVLRAVSVPVNPPETCKAVYRRKKFTNRMFCAGNLEGGKDTCLGDSGGPAVHLNSEVQYGITSWGVGCARKGRPGVYTSIPSPAVRDWITQVTGI